MPYIAGQRGVGGGAPVNQYLPFPQQEERGGTPGPVPWHVAGLRNSPPHEMAEAQELSRIPARSRHLLLVSFIPRVAIAPGRPQLCSGPPLCRALGSHRAIYTGPEHTPSSTHRRCQAAVSDGRGIELPPQGRLLGVGGLPGRSCPLALSETRYRTRCPPGPARLTGVPAPG